MNNSLKTSFRKTKNELGAPFRISLDSTVYCLRVIAAFGVLFNLATILLLFNKRFKHKFYDFLQCRCACNLIVCLLATISCLGLLPCIGCEDDYASLVILTFVWAFPGRMALMASAISDNLLILNRLVTLYQWKNSIFKKFSKKVSGYKDYSFRFGNSTYFQKCLFV